MTQDELIQLEYTKLKEEQLSRIGYRDNIVYLSIVAIGAVCSFAITDKSRYPAFLACIFHGCRADLIRISDLRCSLIF